jgi:MOSC domain-containing protein YiiM
VITLKDLMSRHAQDGCLDWIGVRPARHADLLPLEDVEIAPGGLEGDHARPGKRAVTLIQAEHIPVIAALAGHGGIAPGTLRRNLVVSGLNLAALRGAVISVGNAYLHITTICAPCSRMEAALGHGGYSAMRGHGGWCAEVVEPGRIRIGDPVRIVEHAKSSKT